MRTAWNKVLRDTLQTSIIAKFKKQSPNIDQYVNRLRFPSIPRIIIYSNVQGAESYLDKIFPVYKHLTPTPSSETDQTLCRSVAQQLTTSLSTQFGGFLIKGFPFNTNQALLLDRYLNGVNLAINIKGANQQNVDESINNLLNYYDRCGSLLRLTYNQNLTVEELQWITREIISNIKLSQ